MKNKLIWLFFILVLVLPVSALAHDINFWPTGYWGPILEGVCPGGGICTSLCDFIHLVQHIAFWFLSFLVFVAVPIMLIWGGIKIMISGGSPEKISGGKKTMLTAVIGLAIGLGAFIILNFFLTLIGARVGEEGSVGWSTIQCTPIGPTAGPGN